MLLFNDRLNFEFLLLLWADILKIKRRIMTMKLIVRADDVGYTTAYNMGFEKAVDNAINGFAL